MEEKQEVIFPDGIIFKPKREGAPEFVKGHLSFKVGEACEFLKKHDNNGWVNIDILKSAKGSLYLKLNTWKPAEKTVTKKVDYPENNLGPTEF